MLGAGALASFNIGSNDTLLSLTVLALIFLLPMVACITAWKIPKTTGVGLLLSVAASLLYAFASEGGGWSDVRQFMSRIYLWPHIFFGVLFLAIGRITRAPESDAGE